MNSIEQNKNIFSGFIAVLENRALELRNPTQKVEKKKEFDPDCNCQACGKKLAAPFADEPIAYRDINALVAVMIFKGDSGSIRARYWSGQAQANCEFWFVREPQGNPNKVWCGNCSDKVPPFEEIFKGFENVKLLGERAPNVPLVGGSECASGRPEYFEFSDEEWQANLVRAEELVKQGKGSTFLVPDYLIPTQQERRT